MQINSNQIYLDLPKSGQEIQQWSPCVQRWWGQWQHLHHSFGVGDLWETFAGHRHPTSPLKGYVSTWEPWTWQRLEASRTPKAISWSHPGTEGGHAVDSTSFQLADHLQQPPEEQTCDSDELDWICGGCWCGSYLAFCEDGGQPKKTKKETFDNNPVAVT